MLRQSRGIPPTDGGQKNTWHLHASSSQLQTEIQQQLLALTKVISIGLMVISMVDFHYISLAVNDDFVFLVMNTTLGYNMLLTCACVCAGPEASPCQEEFA